MELIRLSMFIVMFSSWAQANLSSPFASTVTGVTIPNAHLVGDYRNGHSFILRGMAPKLFQIDELIDIGIQRVLIFKSETKDEVTKEIAELKSKGFKAKDIKHVQMPWKDISNFQDVCEMTLESMLFIEESVKAKKNVYFHCTVGEDRTGYLAGLWGLWSGHFSDVNQAFREEMCARGYESGNHKKPYVVATAVRDNLTPAFMKMVSLLASSRRAGLNLNQIKCPKDVQVSRARLVCR